MAGSGKENTPPDAPTSTDLELGRDAHGDAKARAGTIEEPTDRGEIDPWLLQEFGKYVDFI